MQKKFPSELRYDLVSQDWVLIATGRARRPETFGAEKRQEVKTGKTCPFDALAKQECATIAYNKGKRVDFSRGKVCIPSEWTTISVANKYPAFAPSKSLRKRYVGPYPVMDGVGFHEVIITKDHKKDIPQFSLMQVKEMIDLYHARYVDLKDEDHVHYISIFKNKGLQAGASIAHPHSQLIAIPMTDPDIQRSLSGSYAYFMEHKDCIHCMMLEWDRKDKKRIVFENSLYAVVCPFASRVSFEMRIYPKGHLPYFEKTDESQREGLAEALQMALKKLSKGLNDPDYNYFLHTAPVGGGSDYGHYHWHIEILPKTSVPAGFELGTGIEISTIEPEKAAAFLRKQ
ncbi:MAG: hypothetical protein A2748_03060 [Candidatus Wildermuthbacteria bacterium RIFCSPHIGHO2_01_FULL_45_20]|uniref:Galactose-1-phosphate uridyl transferase N-terminal domain-containing protein n=1 Tax=Candidatus Wildermuthbacteria bacterium RIFCSPHIGHO2_02_FULL_45_25 TaxID=1802450 RepID=A0A1G2R590_9BACT|nr:MAG: hypothetical protein A2748_03060 [Candidatus Wildermuthbacteria bacterium RIFCSPHIGHO2_01_FULL_45_20]OHA67897.1 MAG: hypothetical protein A3C04_04455 [Candidatus Wildermuthbacteria bacterium RIFCSPHIGHO2_02_FULL_45_25]